MPSSPRGVRFRSGQGKRTRPYRQLPGRCGHRPLQNNVRFQRWGRCPHRPVGYVSGAVRKNGHTCTIGFRADVGIGPYEKQRAFSALGALPTKTTYVFSVGGDALIAPWGAFPERSGKTDTSIPSASGPMWASAPTNTTCAFSVGGVTHKNNVRFQRKGRCPHRPVGYVVRAVRKKGHACTASLGPMWASAPKNFIIVFLLCNPRRFFFSTVLS